MVYIDTTKPTSNNSPEIDSLANAIYDLITEKYGAEAADKFMPSIEISLKLLVNGTSLLSTIHVLHRAWNKSLVPTVGVKPITKKQIWMLVSGIMVLSNHIKTVRSSQKY